MTNYLWKKDFDQSKHYAPNKNLYSDDRIMEDSRGGRDAVLLYSAFKDRVSLSQSTDNKEYKDSNGNYFGVYPQGTAKMEFRITRTKYYDHKKLLKEAGLIRYKGQTKKKEGDASQVYVIPFEDWVKKNGLLVHGEWVIEPSSKDFYNPLGIVTVQPSISAEQIEATEDDVVAEENNTDTNVESEAGVLNDSSQSKPESVKQSHTTKYVEQHQTNPGRLNFYLVEQKPDGTKTKTELNYTANQVYEVANKKGYEIRKIKI